MKGVKEVKGVKGVKGIKEVKEVKGVKGVKEVKGVKLREPHEDLPLCTLLQVPVETIKGVSPLKVTVYRRHQRTMSCRVFRVSMYSRGSTWLKEPRPCPSLMYSPPFFSAPATILSAARW